MYLHIREREILIILKKIVLLKLLEASRNFLANSVLEWIEFEK